MSKKTGRLVVKPALEDCRWIAPSRRDFARGHRAGNIAIDQTENLRGFKTMKKSMFLSALALAMGISARLSAADGAATTPVPLTPELWRIEAKAGDTVDLKESNGVVSLTYDIALAEYKRIGHISMVKGAFRLLLKEPLTLTPAQLRILFDGSGIGADNSLRPLIQDETGEVLSYEPHALWAPKATATVPVDQWVKRSSRMFHASEAGGATQNIFESDGTGDGDAWPTGQLRFLGFEGRMKRNLKRDEDPAAVKERRKGVFNLARVEVGGERVPDTEPAVFADMLLSKKGKARVGIQIRDEFQGLPYLEKSVELDYDPADPVSRHQEIRFDVGPVRNSWIACGVTEGDGAASTVNFRWEKNIAPGGPAPRKVDADMPPPIGLLRINPAAHANGVYKAGEPLRVEIRVFATAAAAPVKLTWTLTPYGYEDVLESGETPVAPQAGDHADAAIELKGDAARNAYTLNLAALDAAGKELDRQSYVIGVENSKPQPYASRVGMLRGRDFVKKASYFRTSYAAGDKKFKKQPEALAHFEAMLEESMQMTSYVTYSIDLAKFEILPGVYDFSLLDQVMDAAADRGCAITVRVGHGEMNAPYRWMPYTLPRNFDGDVIPGHTFYGSFEFNDPSFVRSWFKAFEALHARYKSHPAFQGYYLMLPSGEWALPDEPWMGNFAGYAWSNAEGFRTFLKENRQLSLDQLNARWGTAFKDWKEVMPPQPDFSVGKKPDLRPCWLDFSLYRNWLDEWWFPAVSAHIRTFDKERVVINYGGRKLNGEPAEGIVGNADYLHNGGNHDLQGEETLTKAWDEGRLGWISEPHHPHRWAAYGDPGEKGWVLDWTVFVMTAQAGGGGANLHVYYFPDRRLEQPLDLAGHYGGAFAYDRYETFKPILRELHGAKLQSRPKQVAVIQDPMTLWLKHRTIFGGRLADLRQWFELLKLDSVDHEFYRPDNEANYKLVVLNPLDEVLSAETLDAAVRMANNGALVVLSARTGRYCPEKGAEEYPLLRALGIPAPAGAFETAGDGAVAKATADSPFFAKGAGLKFYSQGDMRKDLLDPAIGKAFFKWPYRWIPESDYFGAYKNNKIAAGQILALFPDGGAAVTLHEVGKGRALVFWGVPDMKPELLKGLMGRIAQAAGVVNPRADNPIPYALEMDHKTLKRHYALLYHETPGDYTQKLSGVPDGEWFIDDMVSGERYGLRKGETLRTAGMKLTFTGSRSPLKILRMIPKAHMDEPWVSKYGNESAGNGK